MILKSQQKRIELVTRPATYQIVEGNIGQKFRIEAETGYIKVAQPLDFEDRQEYRLRIRAFDGMFSNETYAMIRVTNINDLKPVFQKDKYEVTRVEEDVPTAAIARVKAYDPDLQNQNIDQKIVYSLDPRDPLSSHFSIDKKSGELRIVKKLNRDEPDGFPTQRMYIYAKDEDGGPKGIESFVEFIINLIDINDNAPFLDMPNGLTWRENRRPGRIGKLEASDNDTPENGPPFTFELDRDQASVDIKAWFGVERQGSDYVLVAKREFDREQKKEFSIPIKICDKDKLCATSDLTLTIGDVNDNPMESGSSEVFVYNFEGKAPATQIGRVYVQV